MHNVYYKFSSPKTGWLTMKNTDAIKLFFSKMKCTNCENPFNDEDIEILRQEDGYTVVRICCEHCQKNIGVAILGIDKDQMQKSLEMHQPEVSYEPSPIDYDDVLEAKDFFQSLGDDWLKFIPSKYK